jgi:hypothetical protein
VKHKPAKTRIEAELNWLSENSRDDDIDMPNRPRREVWRSSELEQAMRRPSSTWRQPEGGRLKWRKKERT